MHGIKDTPYPLKFENVVGHFLGIVKVDNEGNYELTISNGFNGPHWDSRIIPDSEQEEYKEYCEKKRQETRSLAAAYASIYEYLKAKVSTINEALSS
jgi:hypothetical protein